MKALTELKVTYLVTDTFILHFDAKAEREKYFATGPEAVDAFGEEEKSVGFM